MRIGEVLVYVGFILIALAVLISITGCGNIVPSGGDKYSDIQVGYVIPNNVDIKSVTELKTLKDNEQVVKVGDKEMYIYSSQKTKDRVKEAKKDIDYGKVKDKDMIISGASIEDEECYFKITSSTSIIEIPDFSDTKEWAYNGTGWNYETIESNCGLLLKGNKVVMNTPFFQGSGLGKKTTYPDLVDYPSQYENTSIPEYDEFGNITQNWSMQKIDYFTVVDSNTIVHHFKDYYDPTLTWNYTEGLFDCWSFDSDYTGEYASNSFTNNDVSINGTYYKVGNGSAYFDGNDYLNNVDISSISAWPITESLWIRPTATSGNNYFISLDKGSLWPYACQVSNGALKCMNSGTEVSGGSFSSNNWYHITAVYKNDTMKRFYINGVNIVNYTGSKSWSSSYDEFLLGTLSEGLLTDYFHGQIDEVALYNYELNNSNIAELYNSGSGVSCTDIIASGTGGNVSDSCTYSSGNWNIDCSDYCNITTNVDVSGIINATGTGSLNITSGYYVNASGDCAFDFTCDLIVGGDLLCT